MKKPRGRPPLPAGQAKDSILVVRITRQQKARWTKSAQRAGLKLNADVEAALDERATARGL